MNKIMFISATNVPNLDDINKELENNWIVKDIIPQNVYTSVGGNSNNSGHNVYGGFVVLLHNPKIVIK